jgi:hypothetical protein
MAKDRAVVSWLCLCAGCKTHHEASAPASCVLCALPVLPPGFIVGRTGRPVAPATPVWGARVLNRWFRIGRGWRDGEAPDRGHGAVVYSTAEQGFVYIARPEGFERVPRGE